MREQRNISREQVWAMKRCVFIWISTRLSRSGVAIFALIPCAPGEGYVYPPRKRGSFDQSCMDSVRKSVRRLSNVLLLYAPSLALLSDGSYMHHALLCFSILLATTLFFVCILLHMQVRNTFAPAPFSLS